MPITKNLVDASFLVAVAKNRDKYHHDALTALDVFRNPYVIPELALVEAYHHIYNDGKNRQGAINFLRNIYLSEGAFKNRTLEIQNLTGDDRPRVLEIMTKFDVDFVDAVIMALSERLNIRNVMTFDVADFGKFVKKNGDSLWIIPAYG
jgi:predicted nucleic acid-binding protein